VWVSERNRSLAENRRNTMARKVSAVPQGFNTVSAHLVVACAEKAIAFYTRAFGAEELFRMPTPNGKGIAHAELKIGDSIVMLQDECPEMGARSPLALGGTPAGVHLYVEDVDAVFKRAIKAGAREHSPVADMFWGDRYGRLVDPSGHEWGIATRKEDLTPEEIGKRAEAFFAASC
jgi:PhnB protein